MDEISKSEGKGRANLPFFALQNRLTLGLTEISFFFFLKTENQKYTFLFKSVICIYGC